MLTCILEMRLLLQNSTLQISGNSAVQLSTLEGADVDGSPVGCYTSILSVSLVHTERMPSVLSDQLGFKGTNVAFLHKSCVVDSAREIPHCLVSMVSSAVAMAYCVNCAGVVLSSDAYGDAFF